MMILIRVESGNQFLPYNIFLFIYCFLRIHLTDAAIIRLTLFIVARYSFYDPWSSRLKISRTREPMRHVGSAESVTKGMYSVPHGKYVFDAYACKCASGRWTHTNTNALSSTVCPSLDHHPPSALTLASGKGGGGEGHEDGAHSSPTSDVAN